MRSTAIVVEVGDRLDAYAPIDAWDEMFDADGEARLDYRSLYEHVLVARGRDYSDVTPLEGVYNGPPSRSSEVRVTIRRVA